MNDIQTAPEAPVSNGTPGPTAIVPDVVFPDPTLRLGYDPSGPPDEVAAIHAYIVEFDELLAHLAAHPDEHWVAYRGSQRVGFGADDLALHNECAAKFPDGRFHVYGIDPILRCSPDEIVI